MGKDEQSKAQNKDAISRRDFLKLAIASGTIAAFTPFIDWGRFMPNPTTTASQQAKVVLPTGRQANARTFPIDHAEVVIYPTTGDEVLDKEPFRTWQLIRLPAELGGARDDVSAFRLYSSVCLHLWCLWKYNPIKMNPKTGMLEGGVGFCPCHGSRYDPSTGKAVAGPASYQSPPSNVLPKLDLEMDSDGYLWISPPTWDPKVNGIIGYGRYLSV
jgi:ubiquinol-cytochrome c reductase iron-sulfur subunit